MTTQNETTVEECVEQALAFLAQSEAEFEAGDTRQGAEKLYGAACQVVIAAAKQRGWAFRSHRDNKNTAIRLAQEYGDRSLSLGFTVADRFRIHSHYGDMEDYQIEADRPAVSAYVRQMAALVEQYDSNGGT